jgi:hypothetical protein
MTQEIYISFNCSAVERCLDALATQQYPEQFADLLHNIPDYSPTPRDSFGRNLAVNKAKEK